MKEFLLSMRIATSDNMTEEKLLLLFNEYLDSIPKSSNDILFKDGCLVETIVEEQCLFPFSPA